MEKTQNLGTWSAYVKNDAGKRPTLIVDGTFPTNGQKPVFSLTEIEPQGINPTDLLLKLSFAAVIDPKGTSSASVHFRKEINTTNEYKSVTVMGDGQVTVANILIK